MLLFSRSVVSDFSLKKVAHRALLSVGLLEWVEEYWNGLPFPFPGDLHDPGIKPVSLALQAILYP